MSAVEICTMLATLAQQLRLNLDLRWLRPLGSLACFTPALNYC
jgi:hypothetical protein